MHDMFDDDDLDTLVAWHELLLDQSCRPPTPTDRRAELNAQAELLHVVIRRRTEPS